MGLCQLAKTACQGCPAASADCENGDWLVQRPYADGDTPAGLGREEEEKQWRDCACPRFRIVPVFASRLAGGLGGALVRGCGREVLLRPEGHPGACHKYGPSQPLADGKPFAEPDG